VAEAAVENNNEYYQGVFWAVYMMQAIFGNLIGYFILEDKENFLIFFVIMTLLSIAGLICFICIFNQ